MSEPATIGRAPWTRAEMIARLEEFSALYKRRPIKDNTGGMLSPHMFLAWFVLQAVKPRAVVESGVWLGQGTWFFERACPEADLYCIDLNLDRIRYRSERARYFDRDFATLDWSGLPRAETLLFFDDHQNAYERLKTAKWFGFSQLIFEDNYPAGRGDAYSLKKIFMHGGSPTGSAKRNGLSTRVQRKVRKLLGSEETEAVGIPTTYVDGVYLRHNIEIYCELPPVFRGRYTRWGDLWDDEHYPTPEPLLTAVDKEFQRRFLDEANAYTWMCYVRLK